jgi:hypothetical protein
MLKLNASYSKKVPAEQDFSSQQYHASVELELSDALKPEELQQRIHETFQLVRQSVETELNGKPVQLGVPEENAPAKSPRKVEKASNKQIKFLTDLAMRCGYKLSDINRYAAERFDVSGIYDLDRKQASLMIDDMATVKKAA